MTVASPIAPLPQPALTGHALGHMAAPARFGWGRFLGFVLLVIAPVAAGAWYLSEHAAERYASRAAFSIRSNETTAPLEIFGAITQLGTPLLSIRSINAKPIL